MDHYRCFLIRTAGSGALLPAVLFWPPEPPACHYRRLLAGGSRNAGSRPSGTAGNRSFCTSGGYVKDIVDNRLHGHFNLEQAAVMLKVAISCLEERNSRPT